MRIKQTHRRREKRKKKERGLEGGVKHDRPGQRVGVRKRRVGKKKKAALTKVEVFPKKNN